MFGQLGFLVFNTANTTGRLELTRKMGAFWGQFSHSENPGTVDGLNWRPWRKGSALMRFDNISDGGSQMIAGEETENQILSDLLADQRLTPTMRCQIFESVLVDLRATLAHHRLAEHFCAITDA